MKTPRSDMAVLNRRATLTTSGILIALAGVAWYLTVRQAAGSASMAMGLGQIAGRMPADMSAPLFMAMWITMMVAMMFPTIAPMVLAHRMVVRKRHEGWLSSVAFVIGYLAVWAAIGLVPLAVFIAFRSLTPQTAPGWLPIAGGITLVAAGIYQFTPLKGVCLKACRTPFSFILTHDFSRGAPGALRAGTAHGAYCLGCCWAMMSVLVVVGLMNLVWMAAIAVVFLAEKNWRHGVGLSRVAGALVVALGLVVIVDPAALAWLSGANNPAGMGG